MQSSARKVFTASQLRADNARHIPNTTSADIGELLVAAQGADRAARGEEAAGARAAHQLRWPSVVEDRPAADQHYRHGVVVAVDHPGQPAVLVDGGLGVSV